MPRPTSVRGSVSYSKGNNPAALADFDKSIRLDPEDASAYFNRGVAYFFVGGRIADAQADFKKANHSTQGTPMLRFGSISPSAATKSRAIWPRVQNNWI